MIIHQWIRLNDLYKQMKKRFLNFEFVFELLAQNRKISKGIARREYLLNFIVLCINGFVSNKWKAFFIFWIYF